jgi:hypothetical protein
VRIGLVLQGAQAPMLAGLRRQTAAIEELGLDLAWIEPAIGGLTTAAALAPRTTTLRLVACAEVDRHPLEIAEAAVVADNCSNGRLTAVLADRAHDGSMLREAAEVFLRATAPRPFAHAGARWRIPAGLPQNAEVEQEVRLTPAAVQLELPLWLAGPQAAEVARAFAVAHVAGEEDGADGAAREWSQTATRLEGAAHRLRRPALRRLALAADGRLDADALVTALRGEERDWGMDTVFLRLPEGIDDRAERALLAQIASDVAPRVQLAALPDGLERHWADQPAAAIRAMTTEGDAP